MAVTKIREPRQQRSIEKKNKIIEVGFGLMCDQGYHRTTTTDIAKAAGVSTGIIYSSLQHFRRPSTGDTTKSWPVKCMQ